MKKTKNVDSSENRSKISCYLNNSLFFGYDCGFFLLFLRKKDGKNPDFRKKMIFIRLTILEKTYLCHRK